MKKAALLSLSNRDGIVEFARFLEAEGYTLLTTSGTGKYLEEEGIKTVSIESYTGQREILDGRVKTLHPKIHAGLLACRDNPQHLRELESEGILPIEVAVVNLYPFSERVKTEARNDPAKMVESIDIGGPTMIRAAAKNWNSIYAVIHPSDYGKVTDAIRSEDPKKALQLRLELMSKVYAELANYNLDIARYFSSVEISEEHIPIWKQKDTVEQNLSPVAGKILTRTQMLRYGENPHQSAALYSEIGKPTSIGEQLGGKELSYNNLLDFDAALRLLSDLPADYSAAVIMKHLNPCGAAIASSLLEALVLAKKGDPRSHFGGIIGLNKVVDIDTAQNIASEFAEIVIAPGYTPDALRILQKKANLRVLQVSLERSSEPEMRTIGSSFLVQTKDSAVSAVTAAERVAGPEPSAAQLRDLQLAWILCSHVKSNAITIVKDGHLVAAGAGQMSRIDSVELAVSKAKTHGHDLYGAVAASDAFFPFEDGVETLAAAGVKAIVVPGGAKRDSEIRARAEELGISMLFASDRHFRH